MTGFVGRISFRHRWLVILAWVVIAAGGGVASGTVFERLGDGGGSLAGTETGAAYEVLDSVSDDDGSVIALWENVSPASVASNVERAAAEIGALQGVKQVRPARPAADGRGLAVEVVFAKDAPQDTVDTAVDAASSRLRRLAGEVAGSSVRLGGDKVLREQINAQVQRDLGRAEYSSLPLTVVIMIFVFGGILAAGLPLLATMATVAGAFAVLLGFSEVVDLDPDIISVVSMLGLALCIDYSLLLVARYREELALGHPPAEAVERTWRTAGRTISFSALTVAAALAGLLFFDVTDLRAMGAAGISATVVALLSALTLTAALLRVFGRRIKPPRAKRARRAEGFFSRLAAITQRRPLLFFLGTAGVLLALGSPLVGATVRLPDMEGLPREIESVAVYDTLAASYGQNENPPVAVLARGEVSTLDRWAAEWSGDPVVAAVDPARELAPGLVYVPFRVHGDGQSAAARDLVERMRAARPPGAGSWVIGRAAAMRDIQDKIVEGLPIALSVIAVAMFLLLFLMTGSLVVPLKALVMNVVSLGATFGVLVAVFEHGWLSGPLDTLTVGGLSPFVIVLVFAFGFGLSMDYEVFLLARIKERVDAGEPTDVAVRQGLQHSGRIITSAALLMLVVFAFFAAARIGDIEQIGLGLFVAVLIDATIVRCLLVPATMTLLGRWNWWAPSPLRRLVLKPA